MSHISSIISIVERNTNFRSVVFTGVRSQLVVMDIPVGGEIGEETHVNVEQTIFIHRGEALSVLDGVEEPLRAGDVVVVTPGTRHNIINTGSESLKVYTVYAPANHIDERVHATKADADADTEDETFGENVI